MGRSVSRRGAGSPLHGVGYDDGQRIQVSEVGDAAGQVGVYSLKAVNKAQELEKSGKKVAGGMHKFDANEVDVNGGDATADDFLDAFGF